MKKIDSRIDDAVSYLKTKISGTLASEVDQFCNGNSLLRSAISPSMSLGFRLDHLSNNFEKNSSQRQALRALLLCQYIYHSYRWKKYSGQPATLNFSDPLDNGFIELSKSYWLNRSEQQLIEALRLFTFDPNATADSLAKAALQGKPTGPSKINLHSATRKNFSAAHTSTCYVAVMMWLFKADMVSLPWLTRFYGANTQASLTDAFGSGTLIWNGSFGTNDQLQSVPSGHIVHLWQNDKDPNWNGHWVVSLGSGKAAGVNNNTETNCIKSYCTTLTLDGQFLDYGGGKVEVIDPSKIPNRV